MKDLRLALLAVAGTLGLAGQTRAGESPCVYERGVVIVPAQVMGIAGDFILDTGSPRTLLAETQAESAGLAGPELAGEVRVAGLARRGQPVQVADLDARTVFLTTPIAGVIGVDALRDMVLDIRFSPCRVWIGPPEAAPRFPRAMSAAMGWAGGLPVVQAAVGDGQRSWPADFTPATGLDLSVRLDDRLARAEDAPKPHELYPGGVGRSRLTALVFMGDRYAEVDAGLMKGPLETPWPAGWIGGPVLSRYRLRFDFPAGQLLAAPAR